MYDGINFGIAVGFDDEKRVGSDVDKQLEWMTE
jgi:hypothetical protein